VFSETQIWQPPRGASEWLFKTLQSPAKVDTLRHWAAAQDDVCAHLFGLEARWATFERIQICLKNHGLS
jgi:hypothetical protein